MEEENWLNKVSDLLPSQINNLIRCNEKTVRFGVQLSEQDAKKLLLARKEVLKEQQRLEFGEGILPRLIFAFCDSAFIFQDSYVETIERLQSIFYLYKNESLDELTDDELIELMRHYYEDVCQGSLDYLEETCLDEMARQVRKGTRQYIGKYGEEDEEEDDTI